MLRTFKESLLMLVVLTVITGVIYPLVVTGIAQGGLPRAGERQPDRARRQSGRLGADRPALQRPKYFWSRASATSPMPYNAGASSGSNQGPLNPALADAVKGRIEALQKADPDNKAAVPVDLVTASGSGLDPHITPAAAEYQVARVAKARGLDAAKVRALVVEHTEGRQLGFLGEPRVNVLRLNLALDATKP